MEYKNKYVTIYMPSGSEIQYATTEMPGVEIAKKIECEPSEVKLVLEVDGKLEGRAYVGMPYYLEMF